MACLAPNKLADGTEVACRECELCRLKSKNDWIGRNIAESKTAKFCYVITATYGRGRVGEVLHERAVILTYSDCQKLMKLLRRHGYEVRYFITGEYGSERQRAHWNILFYSEKPLPAFAGWDQYGNWTKKARFKQRFNWVRTDAKGQPVYLQNGDPAYWWPHGFVHIDEFNVQSVRYVCKYVLKDFDGNGKQGHKGQSKTPPLGTAWCRQLAEKYVEQGLAPQSPEYRFPEAKTRDGQPIHFWLKGRPLEMFLQHFIDSWAERYPDRPRPRSEYVDLFERYGKVVNDEQAMLVRQEFPRGESRQPIPAGSTIKREAEQARYERALAEHTDMSERMSHWYDMWIDEAENEQERQKRQEQRDGDAVRRWYDFQHRWERHWYKGVGWVKNTIRTEPCDCCYIRADHGEPAAPTGARGLVGQQQPLGKVGRWNRDHGGPSSPKTDVAPDPVKRSARVSRLKIQVTAKAVRDPKASPEKKRAERPKIQDVGKARAARATTSSSKADKASEPAKRSYPRDARMMCKARPKDNKPRGGGGAGKRFVPWKGTKYGC